MNDLDQALEYIVAFLKVRAIDQNNVFVDSKSPFSKEINRYIKSLKELEIYINLGLKEAVINRKCLIMDIDYSFTDPHTGLTNYERMARGEPPIDSTTNCVIHLHHIGQKIDSPFAELPQTIHQSKHNYLHINTITSWRMDNNKVNLFHAQKRCHWIKRSQQKNE